MAGVIGKVISIDGTFFAKDADGNMRELSKGDKIFEGETIIGAENNNQIDSIIVNLQDGSDIIVLGTDSQLFDAFLSKKDFDEDETISEPDAITSITSTPSEEFNPDDIDTAAGKEDIISESADVSSVKFAEHHENIVETISAQTREVTLEGATFISEDTSQYNRNIIDKTDLINAINATNDAIETLNEKLADVQESDNTSDMKNRLAEITEAKIAVNDAIENLKTEITNIQDKAAHLDVKIDVSEATDVITLAGDIVTKADVVMTDIQNSIDNNEESSSELEATLAIQDDVNNSTNDENKDNTGDYSAKMTDTYVDGVEYTTTSGIHGFTHDGGVFDFNAGDTITFNVGGIAVGSVEADDVHSFGTDTNYIFLQDIAGAELTDFNNEAVENLAMLFQTLDSDGDASNGITISKETSESLADISADMSTINESGLASVLENATGIAMDVFGASNVADTQLNMMEHASDTMLDIVKNASEFSTEAVDVVEDINSQTEDGTLHSVDVTESASGGEKGVYLGSTEEDGSITFTIDDLLSNTVAVHGTQEDLIVSNVNVDPSVGIIVDNGDNTFSFTPNEVTVDMSDIAINFTVDDWTASEVLTATANTTFPSNFLNVSNLTLLAENATNIANESADKVAEAIAKVEINPTPENLKASEIAADVADTAASTAINVANRLELAITDLENSATAGGKDVDVTDAKSVLNDTKEASLNASEFSNNAELNSDSAVSDLLAAANSAADVANSAVADAEDAADTLAANENPTAADIATANDAVAAADAAIATADAAATTYSTAATDAGESVESTTPVGSTDDAKSTITDAVEDMGENLTYDNINDYDSHHDNNYTDEILNTGDGNDTIVVNDDIEDGHIINTGAGEDTIIVGDDFDDGVINSGTGNDTIIINDDLGDRSETGIINSGSGNDNIIVNGSMINDSSINTADGDDIINIERVQDEVTINTGSGDDSLSLNNVSSGYDTGSVMLGEGDDTLTIEDSLSGTDAIFDGGEGLDNLVLNNVDEAHWEAGVKDNFINFESVELSDTSLDLTSSKDETSMNTHENGHENRFGQNEDHEDMNHNTDEHIDSMDHNESNFENLSLIGDDINIDMGAFEGIGNHMNSMEQDHNVGSNGGESTLTISDVLSVNNTQDILEIQTENNHEMNTPAQENHEWKLGDFKAGDEFATPEDEIVGVEDDATVMMEISMGIDSVDS